MENWQGCGSDAFLEKICIVAIIHVLFMGLCFYEEMVTANNIQKGIYKNVSVRKASGVNYTPSILAEFVADEIVRSAENIASKNTISIFDPAFGDGQLLDRSLCQPLSKILAPFGQRCCILI